jgi:hypothetical protein
VGSDDPLLGKSKRKQKGKIFMDVCKNKNVENFSFLFLRRKAE